MTVESSAFVSERDKWRLPWAIRPYGAESRESYFRRLMAANHLASPSLKELSRRVALVLPSAASRPKETVLELLGGLREGYLDEAPFSAEPVCAIPHCRCIEGVATDRYLCIQCAKGETVTLLPNLKPFVCIKHKRWVGPGTKPTDQVSVRGLNRLVTAARRHRTLVAEGRFDLMRFSAIWRQLSDAYAAGEWLPASEAFASRRLDAEVVTYPVAIACFRMLEDDVRLSGLLNPHQDCSAVDRMLESIAAASGVGVGCARVARLLRYHLRPDFYRVAIVTTPGWHDGAACLYPIHAQASHDRDLTALDTHAWPTERIGTAPGFPGFDDPTSPMYIELEDRAGLGFEFWHEIWVERPLPGSDGPKRPGPTGVWICPAGHLVTAKAWQRKRSAAGSCAACSGRVSVPGVTDIATTAPEAFRYWDHSKNRDTPYWELTAGSSREVDWCCQAPERHEWRLSVVVFMKNAFCKRCEVPGLRYVDVASEFPELISRWDFDRNEELDPHSVAMYVDEVAWVCPKGHPTTGTVYNVARAKLHCTVCTERRVVTGFNDFQTLYPDKAREFAVSRNGGVTPDQLSCHSTIQYDYICARGHVYTLSTRERVDLGIGCTKCTGRKCIPGETDLLTVRPLVAARWDYARNGAVTPDHVHPGTAKTAFFECLCGEPWRTVIRAMRPDRYCKKCAAGIRSGRIKL